MATPTVSLTHVEPSKRLLGRRAAWGLVDQAISSLTNFALTIFVAHSVSPTQFGGFALALSIYFLVAWIGQGVASGPLVVPYTSLSTAELTPSAGRARGTPLSFGLVPGSV